MQNQYTPDEIDSFLYRINLLQKYDREIEKLREAGRDFTPGSDLRFAEILDTCRKIKSRLIEMQEREPLGYDHPRSANL